MLPSCLNGRIAVFFAVRHSHPADVDPSSFFRLKTLRGIIIKPIIPQMILWQLVFSKNISSYLKVSGLIYITILPDTTFQSLNRRGKKFLISDFEIIRAFPHIPEWLFGFHPVSELPVYFIFRFKYKYLTYIFVRSCTLYHIISTIFFPYLWISYMTGQIVRIIWISHQFFFLSERLAVFRYNQNGIALTSGADVIIFPVF